VLQTPDETSKITQDCLRDLGKEIKVSSALNHVPILPQQHVIMHISLCDGDNPANSAMQYTKYQSHLKKRKKLQRLQQTS